MRIAIISDIHGNLEALVRVLSTANYMGVDLIYCLGDIVGYGPFPNECIELVRRHCAVVVKGNHDSGVTGDTPLQKFNQFGVAVIKWTQKRIDPENVRYLKRLPIVRLHEGLTLAHSSPDTPADWKYVVTQAEAKKAFAAFTTKLCFIGHSHIPVIIGEDGTVNEPQKDHRYLINVGSVGQPRDNNSKAAFRVLEKETSTYQLIRVEYDVEKTVSAMRKAGLPRFLADRLYLGV